LYSLFSSLGRLSARPWATTLTLAVLSLALAFPLLFWLLLDNARGLSGTVEDARSISVFLKVGTDMPAVNAMAEKLRHHPDVTSVVVKSPEQGLEEFRAHSGFADALNVLHYNPLPALLIVDPRAASAGDVDPAPTLVEEFRRDPAVDQVQYDAQWKQRLNAILQLARRSAAVLAVLLGLAALLVIGNTVRLDIQGRADEIAVMQLLGADNGFVRRPFLYIGFWYGALAGVVSLILIGFVEWALAAPLTALASSYDHRFDVHGLSIAQVGIVFVASAALGWLGAWIAASRHIALGQPT
jgi:cell division transport system permease protein